MQQEARWLARTIDAAEQRIYESATAALPRRVRRQQHVLRRHARRQQRGEGHLVAGLGYGGETAAARGIAAGGLDNGVGRDVGAHGVEQPALAAAVIGGAAALRAAGGDFALRLVGLVGELVAVANAIGARHAARTVAVVERLDPEIDGAGLALQRMRLDDACLQKLETRRQTIDAGPAETPAHAE